MAARRNNTTRRNINITGILLIISLFTTQYAEARIPKEQIKDFQHLHNYKGPNIKSTNNKLKQFNHLGLMDPPLELPNSKSYGISSPFSLPLFDSLPPTSLSETTPPDCEDSPSATPSPPSTSIPTPTTPTIKNSPLTPSTPDFVPSPIQIPPFSDTNLPENSPITPSMPDYMPSPITYVSAPPEYVPSPPNNIPSPIGYVPGPPEYEPSPPSYVPSPSGGFVPSPDGGYVPSPDVGYVTSPYINIPSPTGYGITPGPPVFQPPPPPTGPPSPYKASVPDPIIEEAMNYACGSGADCGSIQPQGTCYHPETLFAHASFAFNSYWQRIKAAGGTCDFGGTTILVTIDPSFNGCHFIAT
ncbi:hypothetical protein MKX01_010974 [Papaver californicum]|nr:hypothetical protein MKX01_010974 [Papaver californicum]